MQVLIRKLQQEDSKNLRALKLESLEKEPLAFDTSYEAANNWTESEWMEIMNDYLSPSKSIFYVAESEEYLVGFAYMRFFNKEKKKHIIEFGTLYVKHEFRNKGIATKLFEKIIVDIRENHPEIIKIQNSVYEQQIEAIELYKKLGFKVYGEFEKELYVDGKYYKQLAMELFL